MTESDIHHLHLPVQQMHFLSVLFGMHFRCVLLLAVFGRAMAVGVVIVLR